MSSSSGRALREWEEAVGLLKKVDKSGREIVLEVRREVRVRLPPETLDELEDVVGRKVGILRSDSSGETEYLVTVGEPDHGASEGQTRRISEERVMR